MIKSKNISIYLKKILYFPVKKFYRKHVCKNRKIAAFICGDERIIYPAIVSFFSFLEFNDIDVYLYCNREAFNNEQKNLCKKYDINIVDTKSYYFEEKLERFESFIRWPIEVFLNYIVPLDLHNKGYEYAIRLEYDNLCIKKYKFKEILPNKEEVICARLKSPLREIVLQKDEAILKEYLLKHGKIENLEYRCANAGFLVFNLNQYEKFQLFYHYKSVYEIITKKNINLRGEFIEQFILGFLQTIIQNQFKILPDNYIFRPSFQCFPEEKIKNYENLYNIHYSTSNKPWLPINHKSILKSLSIATGSYSQIYLYNIWIQKANEIGFSKCFKYRRKLYTEYDFHSFQYKIDRASALYLKRASMLIKYLLQLETPFTFDPIFDPHFKFCKLPISLDKCVHYEFLFKNRCVCLCIHFEKQWIKRAVILKKFINIQDINLDFSKINDGKVFSCVENINDICLVSQNMSNIINKTYIYLKKYTRLF